MDEKKALEELQREQEALNHDDELLMQKELDEEEDYQMTKLKCMKEFEMISQEDYDKIIEEKKKQNRNN